jgi:hypothetical protein
MKTVIFVQKHRLLTLFLSALCILFQNAAAAQTDSKCDTLVLKQGAPIPAILKHITGSYVEFRPCGQPETSPRKVYWTVLAEIHYADGRRRNRAGEILPAAFRDSSWLVETNDGNEYIGLIREKTPDKIVLLTPNIGEISILRGDIRRMETLDAKQIKDGQVWYQNAQSTRYLYGPNGYGLQKGEAYYQNVWVLFNQISVGVTDHFTLGVGLVPFFLFNGPTPVWLTPKVSIPIKKDKVNVGVGALLATVLGSEDFGGGGSFGVAYGQLTLGSRDRNVNFGVGYGYAGDSWANSPTLSFSTMLRGSKKVAFVSENYLFDAGENSVGMLSAGIRFLGKKIAIDAALVVPVGGDIGALIAIPWLGLNVPFGKKQKHAKE